MRSTRSWSRCARRCRRSRTLSGLVYAIGREGDHIRIVYTLTSMGCPLGSVIERDIGDALADVAGVASVEAELVFEPHWSPEKMSDEAKFLFGVYG